MGLLPLGQRRGDSAGRKCVEEDRRRGGRECGAPADPEEVRESLCAGDEPLQPTCRRCGGKVKPSIVFFGEALPERFFALAPEVRDCRLLLVAGTSLQVHPVASLPTLASPSRALRVLANMELVGAELGFKFGEATDELCGDVAFVGACDAFASAAARRAPLRARAIADGPGTRNKLFIELFCDPSKTIETPMVFQDFIN